MDSCIVKLFAKSKQRGFYLRKFSSIQNKTDSAFSVQRSSQRFTINNLIISMQYWYFWNTKVIASMQTWFYPVRSLQSHMRCIGAVLFTVISFLALTPELVSAWRRWSWIHWGLESLVVFGLYLSKNVRGILLLKSPTVTIRQVAKVIDQIKSSLSMGQCTTGIWKVTNPKFLKTWQVILMPTFSCITGI